MEMALGLQGALKGVSPVELNSDGALFRGFPVEGVVWSQDESLGHHLDGLLFEGVSKCDWESVGLNG